MLSQLLTMIWMSVLLNTVCFTLCQFIVYFQNLTFKIGFVMQFSDFPASENIWGRWKIAEFLSTNNDMKVVVFIYGSLYFMSINRLFKLLHLKMGFLSLSHFPVQKFLGNRWKTIVLLRSQMRLIPIHNTCTWYFCSKHT